MTTTISVCEFKTVPAFAAPGSNGAFSVLQFPGALLKARDVEVADEGTTPYELRGDTAFVMMLSYTDQESAVWAAFGDSDDTLSAGHGQPLEPGSGFMPMYKTGSHLLLLRRA